ncbi:MAG: GGDEF domain-containing protein [Planctomycetes bacterium]|nr:GGDEF domain-containing protein [Planctomycetota bacterium]
MPEFRTLHAGDEVHGLFSPREVEELMRVEFARAQRHKYPVVCMAIGVDRLPQLADLYGYESKEEVLRAAVAVLRAETRDSDFLCLRQDDRLVALFPHTAPELGAFLAKKLLAAIKKQRFERDGRQLRVTLSIGVAHNRHEKAISFETLVRVAEEGLSVADQGGGDRYVETELYQLFEKKRKQEELAKERKELFDGLLAVIPRGPAQPVAVPVPGDKLGETLLEILKSLGISVSSFEDLDKDVIAAAISKMADAKTGATSGEVDEAKRTIDMLERRIGKLTHALGVTEEELKRIAAMKNVELGQASIYRTVQGLSDDASDKERKREMMKDIFHANFELKKRLSGHGDAPQGG